MGFYDTIARFYDEIFPIGESQMQFLLQSAGNPPAKILDVACGTGGYALELSKGGYDVSASDLDPEMIRIAAEKARRSDKNVYFSVCDMRELRTVFQGSYKLIFCIGNSIVHLNSLNEISKAINDMYALLDPGGTLVLQTINYDRIFKYGSTGLPSIKSEDGSLDFVRYYSYAGDEKNILFETILTVNEDNGRNTYRNSITLYALQGCDHLNILKRAGFRDIRLFGNFNGSLYDEDSYLLVSRAVK